MSSLQEITPKVKTPSYVDQIDGDYYKEGPFQECLPDGETYYNLRYTVQPSIAMAYVSAKIENSPVQVKFNYACLYYDSWIELPRSDYLLINVLACWRLSQEIKRVESSKVP